jgi:parallel beta-helix repeat protein
VSCLLLFLLLGPLPGRAQPSGGPYGPIPQSYDLPKEAAHLYYVAPDGQAETSGTTLAQPTTLEAAMARVVTGDAIVLRGGIYRAGDLKLNQGITLQPYADEHPVLKGTQVAAKWEAQSNGLWRTAWPRLFPARPDDWWRRYREGRKTPLWRFNNDMVFVDGELLKAVGWEGEIDAHSYYIDYEAGQVYLGVDPANRVVEITAFDSALIRTTGPCHGKTSDGKGPLIRGLTFTQYAYRALEVEGKEPVGLADPATFGKEVVGTTLENVAITYCSRVAGYFRGDKLTIRHCLVSDTSTEGIYIIGSADCLLEKNIFRRNNIEEITGYYPAAVKIFNQSYRVTCRDNLVIDQPHSNGIWYDVGNVDGVFINNWVEGAVDGFFFEISRGRSAPATSSSVATRAFACSTARTSGSITIPWSTPSPPLSARNEARSAITSAGIPAPVRMSTSAKGTSLSAIYSRRMNGFTSPSCDSSRRKPCADGSPGRRSPGSTAMSTCAAAILPASRARKPCSCGVRRRARIARLSLRRSKDCNSCTRNSRPTASIWPITPAQSSRVRSWAITN